MKHILPGTDGIEHLPVIFISAYGRDETIAKALESGAVDYLVKPFSPTELTARIRAALRRRAQPEPFVLGDLTIDYQRRHVSVAGRRVHLTAIAGRDVAYDALIRQMWSPPDQGDADVCVPSSSNCAANSEMTRPVRSTS